MSNYEVIGVKTFKLSQLSVDALKNLAKKANESIRAEHKQTVKKVLKKVKEQEKVDIKTAKQKLAADLQKKLIRVAKRRKADLISDLTKNKKHFKKTPSKKVTKEAKSPEKPKSPEPKPQEKPQYITRRIGGKIRRIPVSSLKKAEEKKAEKKPHKEITTAQMNEISKEVAYDIAGVADREGYGGYGGDFIFGELYQDVLNKLENQLGHDLRELPEKDRIKLEEKTKKEFLKLKPNIKPKKPAKKPQPPKKKKAEKKTPKKVPKITVTEAEDDGPKEEPDVKAKLPPKTKQNLRLRITPKKAAPKSDELKALKKKLKEKGVSKMVLKFIKSVEQAKEKLEEIEEEEAEDDDSKVIPQFLTMVSSKDRKEVEKLVLLVLPPKEFSKSDQRDYLRDLKDMAEDWPTSAQPRIKYDKFPEAEKELFRMLFPAIFAPKPKEEEKKPKKKVTKSKKNVD